MGNFAPRPPPPLLTRPGAPRARRWSLASVIANLPTTPNVGAARPIPIAENVFLRSLAHPRKITTLHAVVARRITRFQKHTVSVVFGRTHELWRKAARRVGIRPSPTYEDRAAAPAAARNSWRSWAGSSAKGKSARRQVPSHRRRRFLCQKFFAEKARACQSGPLGKFSAQWTGNRVDFGAEGGRA